jgi:hypothetical protein
MIQRGAMTRPAAWAAYGVPCPACGAATKEPCEDPPPWHADPRQTWFRGTGRARRAPHGERIVEWNRRVA